MPFPWIKLVIIKKMHLYSYSEGVYSFMLCTVHHCSKVLGSKLMLLFSKDALHWSKVTVKTFIMSKDFYIHQRILKKYQDFHKNLKHRFFQLILMRDVSWAENQHIRIIFEGSCDTEDWRNYAENSALITGINYILKYIQIENSYFKL